MAENKPISIKTVSIIRIIGVKIMLLAPHICHVINKTNIASNGFIPILVAIIFGSKICLEITMIP